MTAQMLRGAPVAAALDERTSERVRALAARGIAPALAIVRVGEREDDLSYERGAVKRCAKVGVEVRHVALPADVAQSELLAVLDGLNEDATVHGILLFRPLPAHLDDETVRNRVAAAKDVDGVSDLSLAGVFAGTATGFAPCTAQACVEILDHYGIDPTGKRVVVLGRSLVVGRPLAMLLLARHATVTICHTRTRDLAGECRRGEILIACAGRPRMAGAEFLSPGQTVLDVGINVDQDGRLVGDVDTEAASEIVGAVTPVPGGVGSVTTSVLVAHVVEAAARAAAASGAAASSQGAVA